MAVNYGSKRLATGAHYGLRDWLAQRVTGLLMALFTVVVLAQVEQHDVGRAGVGFLATLKDIANNGGDPDAPPHRKDDPATLAKMRGGHGA